ncbi:EBPL [Bugula neritina]|uniref:EBPL n=1 Tax=Bugula neritina TaxID=10212 RepID=A0A7J7IRM9_BUGNE|nr:EBPL [Bugula neritina]
MEYSQEMLISLSVAAVQALSSVVIAYVIAGGRNQATFLTILWLVYDTVTHITLEGPFVYISLTGGVENSTHWLSYVWKEYGKADARWLVAEPNIVAMELLTCSFDSVLCVVLMHAILTNKPWRHFVQITLCVCELYGGYMTFAPEWVVGSPNLVTSNPVYLWVYLIFFNGLWVVIPLILLYQSWCDCLKSTATPSKSKASPKKHPYYLRKRD